jgi:DNA-directed RNA polymerase specialized sigma subunit
MTQKKAEPSKIEYLEQAYRMREYIAAKEEQLEQLRTAAERVTMGSYDRPVGGGGYGGNAREAVICKIADLESELVKDIGQMVDAMRRVQRAIETVDDRTMRLLLEMRYLNFRTWEDISDALCYCERHIYRLHAEAVNRVELSESERKADALMVG